MPNNKELTALEQDVTNAGEVLSKEIDSQNKNIFEETKENESNIKALEEIRNKTEEQMRAPTREKPGFFSRIISFFKFNSQYKSGSMSNGESKQRSDNYYEDFLIAKLAYQNGASDYGKSTDGLEFTKSDDSESEANANDPSNNPKNDSAAINATRSGNGQDITAATDVTYKGRLRLINARANFKHRILGDSTAEYSSEKVSLNLMGGFRKLDLKKPEKLTLLHNYTNGTDKFGAIASAKFYDNDGKVNIRTDSFFIRDGADAPAINFNGGGIKLIGSSFAVQLSNLEYKNGAISASVIKLYTAEKIGGSNEFNIGDGLSLTDSGITIPDPTAEDGRKPHFIRHEDNSLGISVPFDPDEKEEEKPQEQVNEEPLTIDENIKPNEYVDRITIGGVTFYDVNYFSNETLEKTGFSTQRAEINDVDIINFTDIKASLNNDGASFDGKIKFNEKSPINGLNFGVKDVHVSRNNMSFAELTASCGNIKIHDTLKISNASLRVTKPEGKPLSVTAAMKNLALNYSVGALELSTKNISGSVCFTDEPLRVDITDGILSAKLGDIISVGLEGLSYSDGTIGFKSVRAEKSTINFFDVLKFDKINAKTGAGTISKDGIKFGNEGSFTLGAELSVFSKQLGKAEAVMDNSSFTGTLDMGDGVTFSPANNMDITLSGVIGGKYSDGTLSPVTENAGINAKLFEKLEVSAENIAIDKDNKALSAETMSGSISSGDKEILSVTAEKAAITNGSYSFDKLTAKYEEFDLLGGMLSFSKGQFEGNADKIENNNLSATFKAGALSAAASAEISFEKKNSYVPSIDNVGKISASIKGFSVNELNITKDDANAEQTDFSAESIVIGNNKNISLTDIGGSASADEFAVTSAKLAINNIKGLDGITGEIKGLKVDKNGTAFDKVSISKSSFNLCGVISADNAELSLSKSEGDDISLTVATNGIEPIKNIGPINLSANDLNAVLTIGKGNMSLETEGTISAKLGDIMSVGIEGINYSNGTIGFKSVRAEKDTINFFDVMKLENIKAQATNGEISKDGIKFGSDGSLNFCAELSVFSKNLGKAKAVMDNSSFTGTLDMGDGVTFSPANNMDITLSGVIGGKYSDGTLSPVTENAGINAKLFNSLEVSAENISIDKDNKALSAETMGGSISSGDKEILSVTAEKAAITNGNYSFDKLTAKYEEFDLLGGMLSFSKGQFEGNADKIENKNLSATFKAGALSAAASAGISFEKKNSYVPAIDNISNISASVSGFAVNELNIAKDKAEAKNAKFSAKSIIIGNNKNISVTDISGSASTDEFAVESAKLAINNIKGLDGVTGKIEGLKVDKNGAAFDNVSIGKSGFDLCGVISADNAELSLAKPEGDNISLTVSANGIKPAEKVGPIELSADSLNTKITIGKEGTNLDTEGKVTAKVSELFSFSVDGLFYKNGTVGAEEISTDVGEKTFFGDTVKLGKLNVTAKNFALNKNGIATEEGASLSVNSDEVKVLGVDFGKISAAVDKDGFEGSAEFSAAASADIFKNVSAKVAGKVGVKYKNSLDISLDNLSLALDIFGNTVTAEDIKHSDNGITIGSLKGGFSILKNEFELAGSNITLAKEFKFDALSVSAKNDIELFGGIISVTKPGAELLSSGDGINGITLKGGLGFKSDLFSAGAKTTVTMRQENDYTPEFSGISDLSLTIPSIGSVTADDISADKDGANRFIISNITVSAGGESLFGKFFNIAKIPSATLGKAVYENGKIKPDWKTLSIQELTIPITDDINATLNIPSKTASIKGESEFNLKDKKIIKDQLEIGVEYHVLPGVFVKGALFAGAGAGINFDLSCAYSAENDDNKTAVKKLDFKGNVGMDANAGVGVKLSMGLGAVGLNLVEVGLKGSLNGEVNANAAAGIGFIFEKGKKPSVSDDIEKTFASLQTDIKLTASLDAFAGGKIFALLGNDMYSFNIAKKDLAGINIKVNANHADGKWGLLPGENGLKISTTSLLDKMFDSEKVLEYTSKKMEDIDDVNRLVQENNTVPLLAGNMGSEEALDRTVTLQTEIFPKLKKLRDINKDAFKRLTAEDSVFLNDALKRWEDISDYRMNMLSVEYTSDVEKTFNTARSATKKFLSSNFKLENGMMVEKTISGFVPNKDTPAQSDEGLAPEEILKHMSDRAGFLPPAQVLAYLSDTIYFDTGKWFNQNKDSILSDSMKKYTGLRMAINTVLSHPITDGTFRPTLATSNIGGSDLMHAQKTTAVGMNMITGDFNDAMSVSSEAYVSLSEANKELTGINEDIDKEIKSIAENKGKNETENLKGLYAKKAEKQDEIKKQRKAIADTYLTGRNRALRILEGQNKIFASSRSQMKEARDKLTNKDLSPEAARNLTDITNFIAQTSAPNENYTYSMAPLAKYITIIDQEPVSYETFRTTAINALEKNATENEAMFLSMLKNAKYHDGEKQQGKISNQMYKMMFSKEIYSEESGKRKSDESIELDLTKLDNLSTERWNTSVEAAAKNQNAIEALENVIIESNNSYIRAEKLYDDLITITPASFENKLDRETGAVSAVESYQPAVNTLVKAKNMLKNDSMMSPDNLEKVISKNKELSGSTQSTSERK